MEMKWYLQVYEIDVESCSNSYIQKWNRDIYEMCKNTKSEVNSDIRMSFQRRNE